MITNAFRHSGCDKYDWAAPLTNPLKKLSHIFIYGSVFFINIMHIMLYSDDDDDDVPDRELWTSAMDSRK